MGSATRRSMSASAGSTSAPACGCCRRRSTAAASACTWPRAATAARDDVHPWLRPIPRHLRSAAVGRGLLTGLVVDAKQDFAIWQHKRYVHPPALAQGDGPIGKYRTWAAQFYGASQSATVSLHQAR